MATILIYTGLGILLAGAISGFFIALKGMRDTDWQNVRHISIFARFQQGKISPTMKRLISLWTFAMILGLILVGIGISIGLK